MLLMLAYLKEKQLLEAVLCAIASILVLLLLEPLHHYKGTVLELVLSINNNKKQLINRTFVLGHNR